MKRRMLDATIVVLLSVMFVPVQADWLEDVWVDLKEGAQRVFKDGETVVKNLEREAKEALHQFIIEPALKPHVEKLSYTIDNPYKNQVASVRVGNNLNPLEVSAVNARLQKAKTAQEKLLGMQLQNPVRVGVSLSGGGFRAMVGGAGTLVGLEKSGIMDTVSYISMLSGSTWLGPWWAHGGSAAAFRDKLFANITTGLDPQGDEALDIMDVILYKIYNKKQVSAMDFFNLLILNTVYRDFGKDRFKRNLTYQYNNVKGGQMPFFINTAVLLDKEIERDVGEWFEFTSVEAGCEWMGMWTPIWAINRRFNNGQSIDNYFEYPIFSGVYGAAMGLNLEIIYRHAIEKKIDKLPAALRDNAKEAILDFLDEEMLSGMKVKNIGIHPLMGLFDNFTYGMPNAKLHDDEILTMTDAGVAAGNPLPPLLRQVRNLDVIMVFAYSAGDGVFSGRDLRKIYNYAKAEGLPFPEITDFEAAGKRVISVYTDPDPKVPVIVYMPRWNEPTLWDIAAKDPVLSQYVARIRGFNTDECIADGYCDTMNFKYTRAQSAQLSGLTEFNVMVSKQKLIDAIKFKAEQKNKKAAEPVA